MILSWDDKKRKKYKIYSHKLYSAKDISRRIGIEEKKIIELLEEKKTIGRKLSNFWLIRGSEILEINKLLKEKNVTISNYDNVQKEKEKKTEK